MSTVLGFADFFWMWVIVTVFAGGSTIGFLRRHSDVVRLRRVEAKLDLILKHFGLKYEDPTTPDGLSDEVKALAGDPSRKIAAIKLHREQTGVGLKEAKDAVEAYMNQ